MHNQFSHWQLKFDGSPNDPLQVLFILMYTHVLYILNRDKDAQFYYLNDDDWTGNPFKTYQLTLYNMYLLATDGEFQPELYSS